MIFDDYDNISENQVTVTPNSQHEHEQITSLDNFMADREERVKKCDFIHFYDLYQIHINKTFTAGPNAQKRSKNILSKRPSLITSAIKKKKRTFNYLLLLTDKKERDAEENESGIEEDSVSIQNCQYDKCSINSFDDSVTEKNANDEHSRTEGEPTLENEASIHEKTHGCKNKKLNEFNKGGFQSLNWSMKAISHNLALKRSKSTDQIHKKCCKEDDIVQLESFVSLDQIVNKPKPMRAEDQNCAICEHEFVLKDFIARLRTCNHIFHKNCIDNHIKMSSPDNLLCPECRANI